jgi:hypothetical protein
LAEQHGGRVCGVHVHAGAAQLGIEKINSGALVQPSFLST